MKQKTSINLFNNRNNFESIENQILQSEITIEPQFEPYEVTNNGFKVYKSQYYYFLILLIK